MEDEPLLNAGIGACLNADGVVELDAGVMEGAELRAGGVAGLKDVRHPIDLALEVMRDGRHVLLAGDGASRFAREHGVEMCDPAIFITDRKRQELLHGADTVGAVARDSDGHLAVAVSTGRSLHPPGAGEADGGRAPARHERGGGRARRGGAPRQGAQSVRRSDRDRT